MLLITLLLIHLTGLVGYTLLLRKSALSNINKYLLAGLMQLGILIPISFLAIFSNNIRFNFIWWQWLALVASGVFVAGLHLTNILALKHLEASQFTIIYNLRLFMTTILGFIFLNELPSNLQILGGLVIFLSIVVLNLHKNQKYKSKPVLFGLLTTFWFSIHATLEKFNVTQVGFTNFMFWAMSIALIILWLIILLKKDVKIVDLKPAFKNRQTLTLVLFRTMSAWGYTAALQFGTLALINYISGLSVALIVLFGVFILKEKYDIKQKIFAVIIALIGLSLIFLGKLQ